MRIRPAVAADADAILHFWKIAAADAHRPVDEAAAIHRLLARDPDALLLAVDNDNIVGSVIAGWDGWRCHVYRLAVDPARRRAGVGRALIAAAEKQFGEFGGTRSDAMVLDDNALAHHAWTAAGYRRQPEWVALGETANPLALCPPTSDR